MSKSVERRPLEQAQNIAWELVKVLGPLCEELEVCGSIRRMKPTVGDIDLLVVPKADFRKAFEAIGGKVTSATAKLTVQGMSVDVYFTDSSRWVPMLLFLTGSKEENIRLRSIAKSRGWKLSQYGLFDEYGDRLDTELYDEVGFYTLLGEPYKRPEDR